MNKFDDQFTRKRDVKCDADPFSKYCKMTIEHEFLAFGIGFGHGYGCAIQVTKKPR